MKKLICIQDVDHLHELGENKICVDQQTIITPAARDLAEKYEMAFSAETCPPPCASAPDLLAGNQMITKEQLLMLLKSLLSGEDLSASTAKFQTESHPNGLKVVKGSTVQMDVFETGNPDANVHYQELISKDDSKISAGFLEIDHSSFAWELTYEEIDYVISGTLTVTIDGVTYTAKAGDVLFVPKGSKVIWGSPDCAHIFYATYPANWADAV